MGALRVARGPLGEFVGTNWVAMPAELNSIVAPLSRASRSCGWTAFGSIIRFEAPRLLGAGG